MAKITYEETRRRRQQQQPKPKPRKANGHDQQAPSVRHLGYSWWHELGAIEAQDQEVEGLVGSNQLALLYGESSSGKSFLAFDVAAHYALRRQWLGRRVKGGAVLYIAAEGRSGWANRVEAFCRFHDVDEEQRALIPFAFMLESVNLGRTGNGDVAAVIQAADEIAEKTEQAIGLVVTDTMARATPGANENDPVDMGAFVANVDAIRDHTKATQVIVHHSGKNQALGARGHSSLRAAVDCELEVERTQSCRILRVRKSRDGFDGTEIGFGLGIVEVGTDPDGKPITSCVVQPAEIIQGKSKAKSVAHWQLALDALGNTLIDFPVEPASRVKLPSVTLTTVARFRETLERQSIIDGNSDATRRSQWKRIKDSLLKKGHLRIDGELCWRPDVA